MRAFRACREDFGGALRCLYIAFVVAMGDGAVKGAPFFRPSSAFAFLPFFSFLVLGAVLLDVSWFLAEIDDR